MRVTFQARRLKRWYYYLVCDDAGVSRADVKTNFNPTSGLRIHGNGRAAQYRCSSNGLEFPSKYRREKLGSAARATAEKPVSIKGSSDLGEAKVQAATVFPC
jgi:hypothetical protein